MVIPKITNDCNQSTTTRVPLFAVNIHNDEPPNNDGFLVYRSSTLAFLQNTELEGGWFSITMKKLKFVLALSVSTPSVAYYGFQKCFVSCVKVQTCYFPQGYWAHHSTVKAPIEKLNTMCLLCGNYATFLCMYMYMYMCFKIKVYQFMLLL